MISPRAAHSTSAVVRAAIRFGSPSEAGGRSASTSLRRRSLARVRAPRSWGFRPSSSPQTLRSGLRYASFLQSPVALPRERILRAALSRLAPGGRLVLVSHAAPPPWAQHDHAAHGPHDSTRGPHFITPEDELAALGPLESEFAVLVAELRQREVADPQGNPAQIDDSVVVVQRHQALPEVR